MSVQQFSITTTNVSSRIDSVTPNGHKGTVSIKFSVNDRRHTTCQLILAQYDVGAGYNSMTVKDTGVQLNTDLLATSKWTQHELIWNAKEDLDLQLHSNFTIKIQVKDSDDNNAEVLESDGTHDLDMSINVEKYVSPVKSLTDTTPEIAFEIPYSCLGVNMHFTIVIATDSALSNVVQTINSYSSQTGWFFEIAGVYKQMLAIGCPDISAFNPRNARCKYIVQTPLSADDYFYQITVNNITKKVPVSEMDDIPANYPYYPVNLY